MGEKKTARKKARAVHKANKKVIKANTKRKIGNLRETRNLLKSNEKARRKKKPKRNRRVNDALASRYAAAAAARRR